VIAATIGLVVFPEHDVRRFDVAMQDASTVGSTEPTRKADPDVQRSLP
jgi:hypothetical protein